MAHMIWRGAISFGLVHVPVKLYPATSSEAVGFHLLDKRSFDPVGYKQINKRTDKPVTKDDIVRGYEYEKGQFVVLTDDEIRAANPESTQTIDILTFVEAAQISFLYLDTPYYLEPDRSGDKVYALLRDALKSSGRIGVANVVMHSKQHLAALVPMGDALALNTLRWDSEVRDPSELKVPASDSKRAVVSPKELEMAKRLIDEMTDTWKPAQYRDTFHDEILALVERKIEAGRAHSVAPLDPDAAKPSTKTADILDLSELLRRSLDGGKGGKGGNGGKVGHGGAPASAKSRAGSNPDDDSADGDDEVGEAGDAGKGAVQARSPAKRKPAAKRSRSTTANQAAEKPRRKRASA
jgi:DNA end-binding protein Ku